MEGGLTPAPQVKKATDSASVELLINTQEAERQRLSRQMHDGPAQALSNFILQTEIASRLFDIDQVRAKDELTNLKQAAMSTFQKVRNFIFDLRPMMLDDLGLIPTVKRYTETFKESSGMEINLVVTGPEHRLESFLEVMAFRALQELLGNAAAHSQANQVKILINNSETEIRITVEDNGKGFDPAVIEKNEGFGLHLIRERAEMLGGWMEIDTKPGEGTRIVLQIPTVKEEPVEQ
jgi:two-component system sensor histidine kinase DegS